jgi:hypothetical protein
VGGGYPEAGLAHIPLVWMIDRMRAAAVAASTTPLRLAERALDGFRLRACAFEPIHDSRAGLGTFYRYGPRIFGKHLAADKMPFVHPSVLEKMRVGANLYVPLTLPIEAKVWADRPNYSHFSGVQGSGPGDVVPTPRPRLVATHQLLPYSVCHRANRVLTLDS